MNKKIIKYLIETNGLKWNYLIDNSGVSRRSFYNYLNGVWEAPDKFKVEIAKALKVPVAMIEGEKK